MKRPGVDGTCKGEGERCGEQRFWEHEFQVPFKR